MVLDGMDLQIIWVFCSESMFEQVKNSLDELDVPIQYWQLHDWWYDGTLVQGSETWYGVLAVQDWAPPIEYFNGWLKQFIK